MASERERAIRDLCGWLLTTSFAERYMLVKAIGLWAGLSPPWPAPCEPSPGGAPSFNKERGETSISKVPASPSPATRAEGEREP